MSGGNGGCCSGYGVLGSCMLDQMA